MRTEELNLADQLRSLIGAQDGFAALPADLRPEDIADAFVRMEMDERLAVLNLLDAQSAGDVLVELPRDITRPLLDELTDDAIAHYMDILPVDDVLDLREDLGDDRFFALLEVIPTEDAQSIRFQLAYPEHSAGRLMSTDFIALSPDDTMSKVVDRIRTAPEEIETVNYLYVLGEEGHLMGVLTLRRVLRAPESALAREVMRSDPVAVQVLEDQEDAARLMARYSFAAVPVLDTSGRMLGIITADDAQDVLSEADSQDVLQLGAVSGSADSYLSLGVLQLVMRRLPWLVILFLAETLTGAVLRHYIPQEGTGGDSLAVIARLTLFIPLLIGAGGNSGSQVTSTITRALAVGEVRFGDYFRVLRREVSVALIIGAALGVIGFTRAHYGWGTPIDVSLVVAVALPSIILWAALVGSGLPLAAKRLGFDPAVMSAPFISTFVDATGLIIYFELAGRILGLRFGSWL